jgi:hypothetical protein
MKNSRVKSRLAAIGLTSTLAVGFMFTTALPASAYQPISPAAACMAGFRGQFAADSSTPSPSAFITPTISLDIRPANFPASTTGINNRTYSGAAAHARHWRSVNSTTTGGAWSGGANLRGGSEIHNTRMDCIGA